jgi:hypothetical protein
MTLSLCAWLGVVSEGRTVFGLAGGEGVTLLVVENELVGVQQRPPDVLVAG